MSLSSERMLKLMAYADGELDGQERAEVEGWLHEDADSLRFASEVANLGDLVKLGHAGSGDARAIASFDIAGDIVAKLPAADGEARPPNVVPLEGARVRRRSSTVVALVVAGFAAAASVVFFTRAKEEQPLALAPAPSDKPAISAPGNEPGVDVDVDVGQNPGHSVSVFYLPSDTSLTTSVMVWVDETGDKK